MKEQMKRDGTEYLCRIEYENGDVGYDVGKLVELLPKLEQTAPWEEVIALGKSMRIVCVQQRAGNVDK
jgi:hypothetical protein